MYTILITDDEPLECDALELLIKKAKLPFFVLKAHNGVDAVELCAINNPDVVFLDIRMPGMDGLEAAKAIREYDSECILVFLTAWSTFEFAQQAIRLNAFEYLVKPVQLSDAYSLFNKLLEKLQKKSINSPTHQNEKQDMLSLFSREFFYLLKFGNLDYKSLEKYFAVQGIKGEKGIALVIHGLQENEIASFLNYKQVQIIYFYAADKTSILLFSNSIQKFLEFFFKHKQINSMTIGIGLPFESLIDISKSLSTANLAYRQALAENKSIVRFEKVHTVMQENHSSHVLIQEILDHTLDGNKQEARFQASCLIDNLCIYKKNKTSELLHSLLNLYVYEIKKNISLLHISEIPKENLIEQESFFMNLIEQSCNAVLVDRRDKYERAFEFVKDYIANNISEPLILDEVAQIIGINSKYFSNLSKQYLKANFTEYVTRIRMEKAHNLLSSNDVTVKEVATLVGFTDTNYFGRVFREYWGKTPSSIKNEM